MLAAIEAGIALVEAERARGRRPGRHRRDGHRQHDGGQRDGGGPHRAPRSRTSPAPAPAWTRRAAGARSTRSRARARGESARSGRRARRARQGRRLRDRRARRRHPGRRAAHRVPVVLDGFISGAAALVAVRLKPEARGCAARLAPLGRARPSPRARGARASSRTSTSGCGSARGRARRCASVSPGPRSAILTEMATFKSAGVSGAGAPPTEGQVRRSVGGRPVRGLGDISRRSRWPARRRTLPALSASALTVTRSDRPLASRCRRRRAGSSRSCPA